MAQWFVLRRQFLDSSLWLLGSTAGVGSSFWLVFATGLVNPSAIMAGLAGVLVYPIAPV